MPPLIHCWTRRVLCLFLMILFILTRLLLPQLPLLFMLYLHLRTLGFFLLPFFLSSGVISVFLRWRKERLSLLSSAVSVLLIHVYISICVFLKDFFWVFSFKYFLLYNQKLLFYTVLFSSMKVLLFKDKFIQSSDYSFEGLSPFSIGTYLKLLPSTCTFLIYLLQ